MNFKDAENAKTDRSQVAAKTAQLLMLLAEYGTQGVRLKDLAEHSGIARPTVHRILQELAQYRFVRQLDDKKYALGSTVFHLGLSAPQPIVDAPKITAIAQKLSDETGDTCYVAIKSFDGVYYLARTDGGFHIRAQSVAVGERRTYVDGYCGVAILAAQDTTIQQQVLQQLAAENDFRLPAIQAALTQYAQEGVLYGAQMVLQGVNGVACTVPVSHGRPFAAISISAIESRLRPERVVQLIPQLKAAAEQIGACFLQTEDEVS